MKTVYLVTALALAGIGAVAQAAVTANLSSQQIGAGDTVQLEVRSDTRHGGAPDLAPLERDFRVVGTSSGSSIQIVNGSMSVTAQVQVVLQPKHAGVLQIPPLRWDDETTPALALTVSAGAAPSAAQPGAGDTSNHVRVEATLAPGPVYVGGAALLTVRVLTDQPLDQAGLDAPANADLALQQIGTDQQIRETRDGNAYQGIVRYYLVRPQRSGALVLPGPVLTAQIEVPGADPFNDPFFARAFGSMHLRGMPGARRTVQIKAKDIALAVRPRPASVDGKDWLPAASLTLAADTGPAAGALHVGDPLTLHLQLHATGASATQLPDLSGALALPDGLKAYPDQPKLGLTLAGSEINASRDQDVALIASRPGRYTVPALAVRWWDVHAGVARVAQVPARVIDVLPALASAAPATAPAAAPVAAPQQPAAAPAGLALSRTAIWIAAGVALLIVLMGSVWWWRRRGPRAMAPAGVAPRVEPSAPAPGIHPDAAMRAVRASAAANDADATRRALLALAAVSWPGAAPSGLHALAAQLAPPLRLEVEALDRACYTGLAWQGATLAQALDQWPQAAAAEKQGAGIADLYL